LGTGHSFCATECLVPTNDEARRRLRAVVGISCRYGREREAAEARTALAVLDAIDAVARATRMGAGASQRRAILRALRTDAL
jgi:hypothetical protein